MPINGPANPSFNLYGLHSNERRLSSLITDLINDELQKFTDRAFEVSKLDKPRPAVITMSLRLFKQHYSAILDTEARFCFDTVAADVQRKFSALGGWTEVEVLIDQGFDFDVNRKIFNFLQVEAKLSYTQNDRHRDVVNKPSIWPGPRPLDGNVEPKKISN